jgi:peroxiredoxin Q/BCP
MWRLLTRRGGSAVAEGGEAPPFDLPDQHGRQRRLSDYRGRWVVLYFYPRDDTPGCTMEACQFRDGLDQLHSMGADVLGISVDSPESHAQFAGKFSLPFPLLSDADGGVARSYGSLLSLGPLQVAKRHTFIIDDYGKVAKIYRKVKPRGHGKEVLADIRMLQQSV